MSNAAEPITAPVEQGQQNIKHMKNELLEAVDGVKTAVEQKMGEFTDRQKEIEAKVDDIDKHVAGLRRSALNGGGNRPARPGQVSEACARYLGGLAILAGVRQGHIEGAKAEKLVDVAKGIMGSEVRTALTSSDIPLPTEFSGDLVELVSQYGTARQYGTVFPLGAGTVKLPYLSTDTTFTLNLISAAITEKSPAVTNVTFTPEKFGGLIRLPTEIGEDSIVQMGQFLARYAARNIARAEDHNFWAGTGAASGVNGTVAGLTYSTITNSKVTQMSTGNTKYSQGTLAYLRTLRSVPDAAALRNSAYYMHPSFEQLLSTFNSSGDRPYNPNAQIMGAGAYPIVGSTGPTLDGFPIRWIDTLPAYSTSVNVSKVFILFGDTSLQYLGIRAGIRMDTSKEAGFTTDEILVRCLERFTIGLMATGAVAGLETAAS